MKPMKDGSGSAFELDRPRTRWWSVAGWVVGAVAQAAAGVVILASGLVVPSWAVAILALVWVLGTGLMTRWRARPARLLAVPVLELTLLVLTAAAGGAWLGWRA